MQFHQNVAGGFQRGDRWQVTGVADGRVELSSFQGSQRKSLPVEVPERFEVYRESQLNLAVGDKLRFTLGGMAVDGKRRISNGRLDELKAIDPRGQLVLQSGLVVDGDYGHLDLGYVITSHASQGKDRQVAIAAMGSQSLPAINARQFYVTASRASEDLTIYVDDKSRIRRAIERSGEQLSATKLTAAPEAERTADAELSWDRSRTARQGFRQRFVGWFRDRLREQRDRLPSAGRDADFGRSVGFGPSPGLSRS